MPPVGAVYEDVKELSSAENSPPQLRRGGAKRRGGVGQVIDFLSKLFSIASPYRARVRSALARRFAAPLLIQGGDIAIFQFIHTFYDRAQFIGVQPDLVQVRDIVRGHRPRLQGDSKS